MNLSITKSTSYPYFVSRQSEGVSNKIQIHHSPSFVDVSKAGAVDPQQLLGDFEFKIGLNNGAFDSPRANQSVTDDVLEETQTTCKIGQWILGKTIGEGSSGKVKMAMHSTTKEKCVVKAVRRPKVPNSHDQPISSDVIGRIHKRELLMIREAALGVVMNHPNIVRLHSTALGTNHFYCFFEYVSGYDLVDYITQLGRLSEHESRVIFRQMVSAIGISFRIHKG